MTQTTQESLGFRAPGAGNGGGGGGGGGAGTIYTATTTADFVQPAASASVTVSVDTTKGAIVGESIYIAPYAGFYLLAAIVDASTLTLTNTAQPGYNADVGATIDAGANVTGIANGFDLMVGGELARVVISTPIPTLTTADYVQPAPLSSVDVDVNDPIGFVVDDAIYVSGNLYAITAIAFNRLTLLNLPVPGQVPETVVVAAGAPVYRPAEASQIVNDSALQSPSSSTLRGALDFQATENARVWSSTPMPTLTTVDYIQPAPLSSVDVDVSDSTGFMVDDAIYVSGNLYAITAIAFNQLTLLNLPVPGQVPETVVVAAGAPVYRPAEASQIVNDSALRSPSSSTLRGALDFQATENARVWSSTPMPTATSADYIQPDPTDNVDVSVDDVTGFVAGDTVYVDGGGVYGVIAVAQDVGALRGVLTLLNVPVPSNAAPTTLVSAGAVLKRGTVASQILNDTPDFIDPTDPSLKGALAQIAATFAALTSSLIANASTVVGTTVTDALNTLKAAVATATAKSGLRQTVAVALNANATPTSSTANPPTAVLFSTSITMGASGVLVGAFQFCAENTLTSASNRIAIYVDGVLVYQVAFNEATGGQDMPFSLPFIVTGLAAGARAVEARWGCSAGTLTCDAGTSPTARNARFFLQEFGA